MVARTRASSRHADRDHDIANARLVSMGLRSGGAMKSLALMAMILTACSYVSMRDPQLPLPARGPVDCTETMVPPVSDGVMASALAGGAGLRSVIAASLGASESNVAAGIALLGGASLAFAVSMVHGIHVSHRCRAARAAATSSGGI